MRKFLGIVVLAAGVGGLGYWGAKDHALDMQNAISERATAAMTARQSPTRSTTTPLKV